MYPYFQKNQKPNPSNSSKLSVREASPADPLRQFLAENPAFGTLLFQVTGGASLRAVTAAFATLRIRPHRSVPAHLLVLDASFSRRTAPLFPCCKAVVCGSCCEW